MDPALAELIRAGDQDEPVRVVARFAPGAQVPEGVEVVSRFGDVATCRIRRGDLGEVWASPEIDSLKAPRLLDQHPPPAHPAPERRYDADDERRPEHLPETGQHVVVGCADWGLDFAHPDFRMADGKTRLIALWDQRGGERPTSASRHGYGVVHGREAIDRALQQVDPYVALGYHPADADLGQGCHGTHCLSIAAASGSPETPTGVAPGADLVFVHLDSPAAGPEKTLGDSVTLIDAIDFCLAAAQGAPAVISLSLGSHGGPHDGTSLVERAIDNAVTERPGRAICQSAGNYYEKRVHTSGRLRSGETERIGWLAERAETSPHQLEVWYSGGDRMIATLRAPEGIAQATAAPGESSELTVRGQAAARIYHRIHDPNNGQNHINAFLYPASPGGRWELTLEAPDVGDGRYHAWVERESGCPACQAHLDETEVIKVCTTGSVCNGQRTIAVGAYDAHAPERPLGLFSSSGPTRDGRVKPDLVAPGVRVLAARSTPRGEAPGARSTRMSGTSMAAPHVAGTVALMFEAAGRPLAINETRRMLSETAEPSGLTDERAQRVGDGYLDLERAVAAARPAGEPTAQRRERGPTAPTHAGPEAVALEPISPSVWLALGESCAECEAAEHNGSKAGESVATSRSGPEPAGWQGERWPGVVGERELTWGSEAGPVAPGRMVVQEVPLLASHRGTHPDLILHWNAIPEGVSTIDVVVHFHGYSGHGVAMRLDADKEPKSGLDFSSPDDPSDARPGRQRPTLCVLPRGNYFGGRTGSGYDHPALVTPTGLRDLIGFALDRLADTTGARLGTDRLILTAHSGGGAGLIRALAGNDPHEVHIFDALYGPADQLSRWAQARIRRERDDGTVGAFRVLYIPGAGASEHSLAVARSLHEALAGPLVPVLLDRYRVEATTVAHNDIPRRFGWRLLADAGAQLTPRTGPSRGRPENGGGAPGAPLAAAGGGPAAVAGEDQLRAQWEAHPRVHSWVEGGLTGYLKLGPLYARHGIRDAAAYLDENIAACSFFGHSFPTHRDLCAALGRADAALRAAGVAPEINSIWSVVARPIRGRAGSLSEHALGLAVDINPATNPLIRAGDNRDVVRVIKAVTGVDLGAVQSAEALRQASTTFRSTFGDAWLDARRQELQSAEQAGDAARAADLRALLAAASRHQAELARLRQSGFLDLDQRLIDALVAAGLTWGGSWSRSKDFMHFELHQARSMPPTAPAQAQPATAPTAPTRAQPATAPTAPGQAQPVNVPEGSSGTEPSPNAPSSAPGSGFATAAPSANPQATAEPPAGAVQPPPEGWPEPSAPGAGVTLTDEQARRIARQYAHVVRFYRRYGELALADQRATGVPAVFTLAQGGIESGWGHHIPGAMLFGVKANEQRVPESERQLVWTSEMVTDPYQFDAYEHEPPQPILDRTTGQQRTDSRGRPLYSIRVKLWFRRFATEAESIANHSRLLQSNRRYREAFQHTDDPIAFARVVARAGYATAQAVDDSYERALISAIGLVNRVAAYVLTHPDGGPGTPGADREMVVAQ